MPLYTKWASILIILIAGVFILSSLRETLIPLTFSVLFSILLHPVCDRLERWRVPRVIAIFLSLLLFLVVIVGLVYLVSRQVGSFAEEIPRITEKAEAFLEQLLSMGERYLNVSRSEQVSEGKKYLLNALSESRTIMLNLLVSTTGTLTTATLVPIYVFFFLLYRDFFRRFVHKAFQSVPRFRLDNVLKKIYDVIQGYLAGLILVIGIVGVLNTIGLLILGIDYAVFFGFLAAFLILIPYIGILIGSILPALMSLVTEESPWAAVGVIGVMAFVQFLEGNFITPNIVGSKVSINPLAAIVALLLGGQLWGLSGLILALPLIAIIKVILDANPRTEPIGFLLGEPEREVAEEKAQERGTPQYEEPRRPRQQPPRRREAPRPAPAPTVVVVPEAPRNEEAAVATAEKKKRRPARRRKPRPPQEGGGTAGPAGGSEE
ncbi:hypothetical protein GCM10027275_00380 [Rhabdobacter roseus]|uniref:Putative PurR-regulated permease PerM n=1 Tax=Rhabdobacter roseus TaxID=1655419 RepID=A0A840TK48_9BACT|nr:AI-2E family transporter [Rhabdobacter roseus]MBB5281922.1 putative PurR-regulated permease PerM [Rhabdobacter roseus]